MQRKTKGYSHPKPLKKRKYLFDLCGGICPICGRQMQNRRSKERTSYMTIDHIYPKSAGGSNQLRNLQPMCRKCNMKKSNTIPDTVQYGAV